MTRSLRTIPRARLAVWAAAAALQAWLFAANHLPVLRPLAGDEVHYLTQGLDVAAGRAVVPDFVWPPLGGYFLGLVLALAGDSRVAIELVQVALFFAAGALFRALARRALAGDAAADLALALFLLDPQLAGYAHLLWPEVLHLVLLLASAALLFLARPRPAAALGAGLLAGLALLTKNLAGPFLPVLAIAAARRGEGGVARRAGRAALFALGIGLVVAPVAVRNGVRHGTYGIANAAPLNVWTGLTDPPDRGYDANAGVRMAEYMAAGATPRERNARAWDGIRGEVRRRGGAVRLVISQVPKQAVRLLDRRSYPTDLLRGGRLWNGPPLAPGASEAALRLWSGFVWGALLVLSCFGLCLLDARRLRGAFAVPVLFLAYNLALFVVVHAMTRFRVPFLPVLALLAAFPLVLLRSGERPRALPLRLVAGALLAAAALYAAFG